MIAHYVVQPELRREITETALGWVSDHHTYHHRMEAMLEAVGG